MPLRLVVKDESTLKESVLIIDDQSMHELIKYIIEHRPKLKAPVIPNMEKE